MTTKLTIDEGNSSTKLGLWHGDHLTEVVTLRHATLDDIRNFVNGHVPVDALIFCSVCRRDKDDTRRLLAPFARKVIILDAFTPMPLAIDYATPATLGPDRIAAAAGAWQLAPGRQSLVVDMGTAITYDVVTPDGHYIGGNIAPGIFVRLEALNHFTKALPLVETDGPVPRWGNDTASALRSGAIRGVVGELQYYRHCLLADQHPDVFLTGGSADLITPFITTPIHVEPNLVLIGLNSILNYNENQ